MEYSVTFETPNGQRTVAYTDADINALGRDSVPAILRENYRAGVFVGPSEIAMAAFLHLNGG